VHDGAPDSASSARSRSERRRRRRRSLATSPASSTATSAISRAGVRFGLRDFYSGNFSIARDAMAAVGGFDEAFARVRQRGSRPVAAAPGDRRASRLFARMRSPTSTTRKTLPRSPATRERKGRTAVQLARKHPSATPDLTLSQFDRGPLARRLARNTLLAATRWWPRTPDVVVRTMSWLGDRSTPALHRVYPIALDYLYWLGVRSSQASPEPAVPAPGRRRRTFSDPHRHPLQRQHGVRRNGTRDSCIS
jgi:hypothetical protein